MVQAICIFSCSGRIICDLPSITFGDKGPDLKFLEQSSDDEEDWKLLNKKTPSGATGPSADHSTGSGYYAYLEASGITIGNRVCGPVCFVWQGTV